MGLRWQVVNGKDEKRIGALITVLTGMFPNLGEWPRSGDLRTQVQKNSDS